MRESTMKVLHNGRELDSAEQQTRALQQFWDSFRVADKVYRRFRLALMTPNLKRHAPRVVEWIPISNN
jgi:hypothetical protein